MATRLTSLSIREQYNGSSSYESARAASSELVRKTAVVRCDAQTAQTTTGFDLPDSPIVEGVYVNVITADATETVDVGTGTDPNGFLAAVSLATVGLVKGSLSDGAITLGALLYEETGTGADVAYAPTNDISSGGESLVYTCSAGSDTAVFDIIVDYYEVTS